MDNIEPFMQVVDTRAEYEQQKSAQETVDEIELSREKYSYNESEDGDTSKNYIKTKYDFNVGESEMTLDFKSFTIKFPSRRQFGPLCLVNPLNSAMKLGMLCPIISKPSDCALPSSS